MAYHAKPRASSLTTPARRKFKAGSPCRRPQFSQKHDVQAFWVDVSSCGKTLTCSFGLRHYTTLQYTAYYHIHFISANYPCSLLECCHRLLRNLRAHMHTHPCVCIHMNESHTHKYKHTRACVYVCVHTAVTQQTLKQALTSNG
jgi:hypothetical protein